VRVYLDACCFSRLTDDQSQSRIRDEAEAVERILTWVRLGFVKLIGSEVLRDEVRRIPSVDRRAATEALLSFASEMIELDDSITRRAAELNRLGYGVFDALHVATAESAMADVLLSTDDRLVKKAARCNGSPRIPVRNPLLWSQEREV
jgi:predicted nucleic acid-binding protein